MTFTRSATYPQPRWQDPAHLHVDEEYERSPSPFDLNPVLPGSNLETDDLELLHHYSTATYISFVDGARTTGAWQTTLPRLAFEYPFLMHGILAVSALHVASLKPDCQQEWIKKASTHESLALPTFRSALPSVNEQSAPAVFAFSSLVVPYTQASASHTDDLDLASIHNTAILPEWIHLLRGTHMLLFSTRHWLKEGPLGELIERTRAPINYAYNPDDSRLAALLPLFSQRSPPTTAADKDPDLLACHSALDELRLICSLPHSPCQTVGFKTAAYTWPGRVSRAYVELLDQRKPEALVVLAHYCAFLRKAETSWFMRHHSARLFRSIYYSLGEGWRHWIDWPRQQIDMHGLGD